jgi:hypothetical protein
MILLAGWQQHWHELQICRLALAQDRGEEVKLAQDLKEFRLSRGSGAAAAASPVHAYRDAYVAALGCGSQSSDVHRYPKGRPPNDNATDTEISRVCSYTETQPQTQTHAVITTIQMLSLAPRAHSKSVAHTTDVTMILFLRNDTSNTQLLLSY